MPPNVNGQVGQRGPDWVRVTIIGPDSQIISSREIEDSWYRLGGNRHPKNRQRARDELAAEELREWLRVRNPAAGSYVVSVAALDHDTGEATQTWTNVRVTHPTQSTTAP